MNQNQTNPKKCHARCALKAGVLLTGAALLATAIANAVIAWNAPSLGARLNGGFTRVPLRHGDAAYFVSGSGSPILLLHAPRMGNSSAEWEENFDELAKHHTVYALDFLGWGLSDKPRHILRPSDYAEQITHFMEDVIGAPCAIIASGQAANFALLASQKSASLISKLVLICPDSSDEWSSQDLEAARPQRENATVEEIAEVIVEDSERLAERRNPVFRVLTLPIIGEAVGNWMTSRAQLQLFASQNLFFDKSRVSSGLVARMHDASHQPSSQNALAAQTAGLLAADWREAWSTLQAPALLIWGRNAPSPGIETSPEWLALKPNARLEVFDQAMLWPHSEYSGAFNARVLDWLS